MNTEEFATLKQAMPNATTVWYDRMHDLNKGQLIETLIVHMDPMKFSILLDTINRDIEASRKQENTHE